MSRTWRCLVVKTGTLVLRRLIPQAWERLVPGGWLLLETAGRTPVLDRLMDGWADVRFVRDLQGVERITVARRPV